MPRDAPNQAFATREANETKTTHTSELESFHEAVHCGESPLCPKYFTRGCESSKVADLRCRVVSGAREIGDRCFHRRLRQQESGLSWSLSGRACPAAEIVCVLS